MPRPAPKPTRDQAPADIYAEFQLQELCNESAPKVHRADFRKLVTRLKRAGWLLRRDTELDPVRYPVCDAETDTGPCLVAFEIRRGLNIQTGRYQWAFYRACKHKKAGHILVTSGKEPAGV